MINSSNFCFYKKNVPWDWECRFFEKNFREKISVRWRLALSFSVWDPRGSANLSKGSMLNAPQRWFYDQIGWWRRRPKTLATGKWKKPREYGRIPERKKQPCPTLRDVSCSGPKNTIPLNYIHSSWLGSAAHRAGRVETFYFGRGLFWMVYNWTGWGIIDNVDLAECHRHSRYSTPLLYCAGNPLNRLETQKRSCFWI